MMYKFLLLDPFFIKKNGFKNFTNLLRYASILPIEINGLQCKFKLTRMCRVFADPVTYNLL